ncbi:MAG: hypothetical protein K2F76_10130, partial [Duncaniella dubosii]|nr:hypothetical protein [Duncaniella dubosii]
MNRFSSSFCKAQAVVLAVAAIFTGCVQSEKADVAPPVKVTVQPVSLSRYDNPVSFSGTVE